MLKTSRGSLGFQPAVSGFKHRNLARFSALLGRFPASKTFAPQWHRKCVCVCVCVRMGVHKDMKIPKWANVLLAGKLPSNAETFARFLGF